MTEVVFLMPHDGIVPSGGYKVVYEYANRLSSDGIGVTIIYPNTKRRGKHSLVSRLRDVARFVVRGINKGYRSAWFTLDRKIRCRYVWTLENARIPNECVCVATAVETAYSLETLRSEGEIPESAKLIYFIQDYENWYATDEEVAASYHFAMKKIVIARWLQSVVESVGEQAEFVPNGFDFKFFRYSIPAERRDRNQIVYMYHVDKRKGVSVAMEAFGIAKRRHPELRVSLFSVYDAPKDLPEWCSFYKKPDQETFNRLYNSAAIYVGSSYVEGWGLTVGEAMQCGCAVACTGNKGYLEMARNEETALVSPVGDAKALAENICRLIEDDALRLRIAKTGERFIHQFDIEESYKKFKECLMSR